MLFPLVTPEIVMGAAMFLIFSNLFHVRLGTTAQLLGHVTFAISYVVIVTRGRLFAIGVDYEEAAMDLGASPAGAMRRVLIPLLAPAILSSFFIVFAISIDDFVISQFLCVQDCTTIPMKIYSAARNAGNPSLNAVATIMMVLSLLSITVAVLILRWFNRGGDGRLRRRGLREARDLKTWIVIVAVGAAVTTAAVIATMSSGPIMYPELRQRSSQAIPGTFSMTLEPAGSVDPALTPDAALDAAGMRDRGTSMTLASVRDRLEGFTTAPAWVIVARGLCLRDAKGELVSDARGENPGDGLACTDATFQVVAVDADDGRTLLSETGYDATLTWVPDVASPA